ncbi:MAG: hypothetical protein OEW39_07525 [Deltaproteobacteria bacterium]|nr:hypothetical protein [Deltaproteobacteria bacterium]
MVFKRMIALAALLLAATAAQAQVAGPTLVPAAPRILDPSAMVPNTSFTAENPAAMMWGLRQRFGGGQITTVDKDVTVTPNTDTKYSGNFAGFEKITKEVAIGLEMVKLNSGNTPADAISVTNVALAAKLFQDTSMGFAINHASYKSGTANEVINSPIMGVGFQKGGFAVGLAVGSDEWRSIDTANTPNEVDYVRPLRMMGVGYYQEGKGLNLHIEGNRITRANYGPLTGTDNFMDTVVAEVNYSNIHVGYSLSVLHDDAGLGNSKFNVIDVGYARLDGFAILYHLEKGFRSQSSVDQNEYNTSAISLALHF